MANTGSLGRLNERPSEELEVGKTKLWVYDDAVQEIQRKGIVLPSSAVAGFHGEMPQDITSLDDNDLGDLLSKTSEYCGYVEAELAKAKTALNSATARLEFVKAKVRLQVKANATGRLTNSDKNDLVTTDVDVVHAASVALYHEAIYDLTKTTCNRAQRNWETISRRITQRGQEVERMRRETNVAGVPAHASRTFRRPGT